MVIPGLGDARISDFVPGRAEGSAAPGPSGTAYLAVRTYQTDPDTGDSVDTTTVMTVSGSTTITQVIVGTAEGGVVAGANGVAYQTTSTFSSVDGSRKMYITRIGGGTSDPIAGSPETDLQVAADGSAFQVMTTETGAWKMVAISPTGRVSLVPLDDVVHEFVVGPDNKAYATVLLDTQQEISILASDGSGVTVPLDGYASGDIAFGADGTPFLTVRGDTGFFIKNLSTGSTSRPIAVDADAGAQPGDLRVGPDGTAWLVVPVADPATPDGYDTRVVAMAPNGETVVDLSTPSVGVSFPGVSKDPGTFGFNPDGTAFLAVNAASGAEVLGITSSGVTRTVATGGGLASPVTVANGTVYWSYTAVTQVGETYQPQVQVVTKPATTSPDEPPPYEVTTNPDPSTGVVTGKVTSTGAVGYTGSTQDLLGTVVVKPDGSFVFTPSPEARALAEQSDSVITALFAVNATDSEGNVTEIPVTAVLLPNGFPTETVQPPLLTVAEFGTLTGGRTIDGHWVSDLFDQKWELACTTDGCINLRDPHPQPIEHTPGWTWTYSVVNYRRTGVPPLYMWGHDKDGAPLVPDVYMLSLLNVGLGIDHSLESYVMGYRKMGIGDPITVKDDYGSFNPFVPFVTYVPAIVPQGKFPYELFKNRSADGVVGGFIFDNEIAQSDWTVTQYSSEEQAERDYLNGQARTHTTFVDLAHWLGKNGSSFVTPPSLLKVPMQVNGALELADIAQDGNEESAKPGAILALEGRQLQPPPRVGIPD